MTPTPRCVLLPQLGTVLGMLDKEIEGYLEARTFRRHSFHKVAHPGKWNILVRQLPKSQSYA